MFTKNAMVKFWLTNFCIIDDDTLPGARLLYFLGTLYFQLFALHDRYFAFPTNKQYGTTPPPAKARQAPRQSKK